MGVDITEFRVYNSNAGVVIRKANECGRFISMVFDYDEHATK
jgi:uncharacterized YccA/Bax inhibitor family protein